LAACSSVAVPQLVDIERLPIEHLEAHEVQVSGARPR
jgi:hypothetical protein